MYYPNFSNETFDQVISKPEGMHPSLTGLLPEAYLKRADVLLALKNFAAAHTDYVRSQRFAKHENEERWRTPPGLQRLAVDVQTLDANDAANVRVWVKPTDNDNQPTDAPPTEVVLDCNHRTVQMGSARPAFEPTPGSSAEVVRDYFCIAQHWTSKALSTGLHNVRFVEQGQNRGCQKQHGPADTGPSFPLKGGRSHVLDKHAL